jgi:hypothetical protein
MIRYHNDDDITWEGKSEQLLKGVMACIHLCSVRARIGSRPNRRHEVVNRVEMTRLSVVLDRNKQGVIRTLELDDNRLYPDLDMH